MFSRSHIIILFTVALMSACSSAQKFDVLIRNGIIYDGSGSASFHGDVAVNDDTIAAVGNLKNAAGILEIDAKGKAVSPGFINVQSWANETLMKSWEKADPRGR